MVTLSATTLYGSACVLHPCTQIKSDLLLHCLTQRLRRLLMQDRRSLKMGRVTSLRRCLQQSCAGLPQEAVVQPCHLAHAGNQSSPLPTSLPPPRPPRLLRGPRAKVILTCPRHRPAPANRLVVITIALVLRWCETAVSPSN